MKKNENRLLQIPARGSSKQNVDFFTPSDGRGFHERAAPCQVESFFGAFPIADQREALQALPCLSFLGKVFVFPRRLALLPFALFSGAVSSGAIWGPQSQIGCCHLGTELSRPVSGDARSTATSQSPELGDGLQKRNSILLSCLVGGPRRLAVAQWFVHFSAHPQLV